MERILYYTAISFAKHFSDGTTVASSALKEDLNMCGITNPPVEVISNGVATEFFDYNRNKSCSIELKKKLKLSEKFVVMYHGSIGPLRGVQQAIEAIARVRLSIPEIIFFVLGAGTDEYVEMLMKLVEKRSLRDNVYIHKPVDRAQVPQFLAMCDVGIDPRGISTWAWNSCPLKLLEYLSMEKPFISTNIPFSAEILNRGSCGTLIPSNEPENIAAAIGFMHKRRHSLISMGKIGRTIVEQYYSWDGKARDLESFLGFLLGAA
jgi:glycosyltransferase involved in cell wall biosynthesis